MPFQCGDQGFGLVPRDLQATNIRVNQVFSKCNTDSVTPVNPVLTPVINPMVSAFYSSVTGVNVTNTPTFVSYDTILVDTQAMSSTSDLTTFSIPKTGNYLISAQAYVSNANVELQIFQEVYVNGVLAGYLDSDVIDKTTHFTTTLTGSLLLPLLQGDHIRIGVATDFAGHTATYYGNSTPRMAVLIQYAPDVSYE